ncbi:MAG TPA: nickel-dependent lactate racemase [Clostridiaceae bacterium]|jgi:nickel-dependent lactate racemase|nr:nickel-dependent lactate racemase [Clostridiaceae bacterium]
MISIELPYGKSKVDFMVPKSRLTGILNSQLNKYKPPLDDSQLVRKAMENPIGTKKLEELAVDKNNIVIIASDHTRPVPSKAIIPLMLEAIRKGNPNANITILIATGCHRSTTTEELVAKFGEDIVKSEKIAIHDCDDREALIEIGTLPSGGRLTINRLAAEADLLLAEGFIEPHFFAGYSGGGKCILPGIASRESVMVNHCSEFISDKKSRTGILEGNPIRHDIDWACCRANLAYIVNVVLNSEKEIVYAVAGDPIEAHRAGCSFLDNLCRVDRVESDIVVTTNGGYPLDQNIYQAVKGMTAAEATVRQDGVIIMLAESRDGHGGESFCREVMQSSDPEELEKLFIARCRVKTVPDQWQAQIFARILKKARIIYVSEAEDELVRNLHMEPAHSLEEAMKKAEMILNNPEAKVAVIPDGVSVIVV